MARPKGRTGAPKRLYLSELITRPADKLAFKHGKSLSDLTEFVLAKALRDSGEPLPRDVAKEVERILSAQKELAA